MRESVGAGSGLAVLAQPDNAVVRTIDVFRRRSQFWLNAGCSTRAASALANAQVDRVDQIAALGKAFLRRLQNCGPTTVAEIGRLIGGWPDERLTPQSAIAKALRLSLSAEEAIDAAGDAISALYRSGFVVVSRQIGRDNRAGRSPA